MWNEVKHLSWLEKTSYLLRTLSQSGSDGPSSSHSINRGVTG